MPFCKRYREREFEDVEHLINSVRVKLIHSVCVQLPHEIIPDMQEALHLYREWPAPTTTQPFLPSLTEGNMLHKKYIFG